MFALQGGNKQEEPTWGVWRLLLRGVGCAEGGGWPGMAGVGGNLSVLLCLIKCSENVEKKDS